MKKYVKLILFFTLSLFLTNCEEHETDVQPPLSVGFERSSIKVQVSEEDPTYDLKVYSTRTTSTDRVINVTLNEEESDGLPQEYEVTFTSITIPAGELYGTGEIVFDFEALPLGAEKKLVFDLEVPEDGTFANATTQKVTINYSPLCTANTVVLDLVFDQYSEETSWQLYDSSNALVAEGGQGGAYASLSNGSTSIEWCLEDGTYTFVIFDAYGDGFCCDYGNGSYTITYNGNILATGGQFGANEAVGFTVGE